MRVRAFQRNRCGNIPGIHMLVTFTDFGLSGPYLGQVHAVFAAEAPQVPVINLISDAPAFDPLASAYLLAAYTAGFPVGAVFFCVIDPGVGSERRPIMLSTEKHHFIGPDNGLFDIVLRRALKADGKDSWQQPKAWAIDWRPEKPMSNSFHGRDLFAPVAARMAIGLRVDATPIDPATITRPDWPDSLPQIIYIDHYGNALTGIFAEDIAETAVLDLGGKTVSHGRVFSDVPVGQPFWYINSNGLVEIAVNSGRADQALGLAIGHEVTVRND